MLTKDGERKLMEHIERVGATVNRTDWRCPKCKVVKK